MKLWKFFVFQKITKFGLGYIKVSSCLKSTMFMKTSMSHLFLLLMLILKLIALRIMKVRSKDQSLKHHLIDKYKLNGFKAHAPRVSKVNHKHAFMYTYVWTHKAHNHVSYSSLYTHYVCVCVSIYIFIYMHAPLQSFIKFCDFL